MSNPADDPNPYVNLQKRVLQRVRSGGVQGQILELVRKSFEDAVKAEGVALTNVEKKHLQEQILKLILDEMGQG